MPPTRTSRPPRSARRRLRPAGPVDEFKLIDDEPRAEELAKLRRADRRCTAAGARSPPPSGEARKIPGRPVPKVAVGRALMQAPPAAPAPAAAKQRPRSAAPARSGARDKRGAQSLEETLEILGAGQLSIDNGNGETLNESGVRHLRVEVQKNSPFSKLLERLSERMKKS